VVPVNIGRLAQRPQDMLGYVVMVVVFGCVGCGGVTCRLRVNILELSRLWQTQQQPIGHLLLLNFVRWTMENSSPAVAK
jgi:hypothetical protein